MFLPVSNVAPGHKYAVIRYYEQSLASLSEKNAIYIKVSGQKWSNTNKNNHHCFEH